MDKRSNETKNNKHNIRDLGKRPNPNIHLLNRPYPLIYPLFNKLFLQQLSNHWYFTGEYIDGENEGKIKVEHRDDEDQGGGKGLGDDEHSASELPIVRDGDVVVLDEKDDSLDDGQDPGNEQELALVFHGFEEYGQIGVVLLIVHKELILTRQLIIYLL